MAQTSIFTQIRNGEVPGQIIYQDSTAFVILTIAPHNPGHCIVIPIEEISDVEDLEQPLYLHLMDVVRQLSLAIKFIYQPVKVAILVSGFNMPHHAHVHVLPLYKEDDTNTDKGHVTSQEVIAIEADKIRQYLKDHPIT